MSGVTGWKEGDEVYVDTSIPYGWPDGVFDTGIREAKIIDARRHIRRIAFLVEGVQCTPTWPERLVRGRIIKQLEND